MHTTSRPWAIASFLVSLCLHCVVADESAIWPRDAGSDLQSILSEGGSNAYILKADSLTFNFTLQTDFDCPHFVTDTNKIGPYRDSRGRQIEEVFLGDIASDIKTSSSAIMHRATRRNVVEAKRAIDSLLSDELICDAKDSQFGVELHDELRRKLLGSKWFYSIIFLTGVYGWVWTAAATWAVHALTDDDTIRASVSAGFAAFFGVILASSITHIYAQPVMGNFDHLFLNVVTSVISRFINFFRFGRQVQPAGDVEMGNVAHEGKLKRDGTTTTTQCVPKSDAIDAMGKISGLKSDGLGIYSWDELSDAAGTCPLTDR